MTNDEKQNFGIKYIHKYILTFEEIYLNGFIGC